MVLEQVTKTIETHALSGAETPVLMMVSGGSDSAALAYLAASLQRAGLAGPCAVLHVNHLLRGADADADAAFVERLAELLGLRLFSVAIDVGAIAEAEHGNIEAVARRERYAAASDALAEFCTSLGVPASEGRIAVAHTADDRAENFYMRSIVGTGPGGFRSMRYRNGQVIRPLLDVSREDLRAFIRERCDAGLPCAVRDGGGLWCEDATNGETDRFRAFVRHGMLAQAKERNPRLLESLTRTMNLIADEDDFMEGLAAELEERCAFRDGDAVILDPAFGAENVALRRRVAVRVLEGMLGEDERIETATVDAILATFGPDGLPISGYVANIQGNLAVSANKRGVRIEPMRSFRARRKRL